jgi:hypothetical protein
LASPPPEGLPRELECWHCGSRRRVDGGERIVSAERRIENVKAILAAVRR